MQESLLGKYNGAQNANVPVFPDAEHHWAADSIRLFTRLGVVKGYDDGTFRPNDNITRGEFAQMVVNLFPLSKGNKDTAGFRDLANSWARDAVLTLASNGIISGYEDGTFRAGQNITRAEMVAIIARIVNLNDVESMGTASFNDIGKAWNPSEIEQAARAGIVSGQNANTFAPEKNATRAEALAVLARTLKLSPDIDHWLASLK